MVSREVIILLVIIGAGAAVMLAAGIHASFRGRGGDEEDDKGANEQAAYRREVIQRNHENIAAMHGMKLPSNRFEEV